MDYPLGGIPEFFVTGLVGGLGVNRDLIIPTLNNVPESPFIRALEGFGDDPMGALDSIELIFQQSEIVTGSLLV